MPNISGIEKNTLIVNKAGGLIGGRYFRGYGSVPLAVSEYLYTRISVECPAVFFLAHTSYTGNFDITLYEGGTINGPTVPTNTPVQMNRLQRAVDDQFKGAGVVGLSGSGATFDDTGATIMSQESINEAQKDQGGVLTGFSLFMLNPDYDYHFVVQNTANSVNTVRWTSEYLMCPERL